MSRVIGGALQTERTASGRRKLLRALVVRTGPCGGHTVTVPQGFNTDFSSIPWFARFVVDWSKVDVAGVVHDYLYTVAGSDKYGCNRASIDMVWYRIAVSGQRRANLLQAAVCWFFIRLFGWASYRKKQGPVPNTPPQIWTVTKRTPLFGCMLLLLLVLAVAALVVWTYPAFTDG